MHRIMLLYPDHLFRKTLWLALVKMGYEVVEAANPREAERLDRFLPADALVADLRGSCEEDLVQLQGIRRSHRGLKIFQFSPQRRYAVDSDFLKRELAEVLESHVSRPSHARSDTHGNPRPTQNDRWHPGMCPT